MDAHDADMMRRWLEGDAGAFEELVRRWQGPMGRFLARLTGEPHLAADLCQEVFLRLYIKGSRYREAGAFSPWFSQIPINVPRAAPRRARHAPLPLLDTEPPAPEASADQQCELHELNQLMQQ